MNSLADKTNLLFEPRWRLYALLTYHAHANIWVSCCLSSEQTSFDAYLPQFQALLSYVEIVVGEISALRRESEVGFQELSMAPSLFFTATKCRDPLLRRYALALLRKVPLQGQLWTTLPVATMVEKLIALEEKGTLSCSAGSCQSEKDLRKFPVEGDRIHHIEIMFKRNVVETEQDRRQLVMRVIRYATDSNDARSMIQETVDL